jgi:hypothetical protein
MPDRNPETGLPRRATDRGNSNAISAMILALGLSFIAASIGLALFKAVTK